MNGLISRRATFVGAGVLIPSLTSAAPLSFPELEKQTKSRIGVAALDTGMGQTLLYRQTDRFLMCSTCKVLIVAAILLRIDSGKENSERLVHYNKSDLLDYSAVTTANIEYGMTVLSLCEAAISRSDNTAAALLMHEIGGPSYVTKFVRGLGDMQTRMDRTEPNLNIPDGDLDTTTPSVMLANMKAILLGTALSSRSQKQLIGWLLNNTTGLNLLRAGLPTAWMIGDKTGSSSSGAVNDIAIVTPPNRSPILIAAYTNQGSPELLSDIGRVIAANFR